MKRMILAFLFAVLYVCGTVPDTYAQPPGEMPFNTCSISTLPTCVGGAEPGRVAIVIDGIGNSDCSVGGGSNTVLCMQEPNGAFTAISATGPLQDLDGDGKFEDAYLWDADGDGSPGMTTCIAQGDPFPECKVAGEKVYPDGMDDINCAIHGCGFGQMENTGVLRLPEGVVVGFPCWDVGAWQADASIIADPVANCPATGINDPRGACQPGGKTGTTTRWDSASGDAAVLASCPVDAEGSPLFSISTQNWQGTLLGAGTDNRDNSRGEMTARGSGRIRGTTIALDTSNNDIVWFSTSGFNRSIEFGMDQGNGPGDTPYKHNGTTAMASADSKGWGVMRGFNTNNFDWAESANGGTFCVCNNATDCDNVSGNASATGWVSALERMDDLIYLVTDNPQSSSGAAFVRVTFDNLSDPGGCGGDGYVQFRVGAYVTSQTAFPSAVPVNFNWGMLATGSYTGFLLAPPPDYFQNRTTMEKVTVEAQDWYDEPTGRCTCVGAYSASSESGGDCGVAGGVLRDLDCDTNPQVAMLGGGQSFVQNVVFKNWHHFGIDGGPHPGRSWFRDTEHWFGHGFAFTDDSYGWYWQNTLVGKSHFTGQPFGSFFSFTRYNGLHFQDVNTTSLMTLNEGSQGMIFENVTANNTNFASAIKLNCGARDNVFRNFQLRGGASRTAQGLSGGLIELQCDAAKTANGFCAAEGEFLDNGGGPTDFWCDNAIRDNLFQNISYYGEIGMPVRRLRFQSIDLPTDVITIETGTPLDIGECSGPWFVFDSGLTPSSATGYAFNVNRAAGTFQITTNTNCAGATAFNWTAGSTSPATSQMSAQNPWYAALGIKLMTANGQENALLRNHFDQIRIFPPMSIPSRYAGQYGLTGNLSDNLVAVESVGTGSTNIEEVLWYNTVTNSSVAEGLVVGQCFPTSAFDCPDVTHLQSDVYMRGGNNTSGGAGMWSAPAYDGRFKEIVFGGNLPNGTDSTWWLPPMATNNATTAGADDRGSRMWTTPYLSAIFGAGSTPEDAAAVGTVDEPVTEAGDPVLVVEGMACEMSGDTSGNVTYTLYSAGAALNGGAVSCTVTAAAGFEDYCSIAPSVAEGAASANTIAAGAAVAVQVNQASGDNTDTTVRCTVYTHPRL